MTARIASVVAALALFAACGGSTCPNATTCVATAACTTNYTATCGVGMVCCPPVPDAGSGG